MNKNDKFHNEEPEVNANAVSDEELDSVAGGRGADEWNYFGPIKGQADAAVGLTAMFDKSAQQ